MALAVEGHSSPARAVAVVVAVLAEDTHQHQASPAAAHLVLPTAILDSAQADSDTAVEQLAVEVLHLAATFAYLLNSEKQD